MKRNLLLSLGQKSRICFSKKIFLLFILSILFSFSSIPTAHAVNKIFNSAVSTSSVYIWPFATDFVPTVGTSSSSFTRNFNGAEMQSSGLWLDRAHLTPRFQNGAYLSEFGANGTGAAYWSVFPGSETRDLSLSKWVKTNMTATKNQTGVTTATATGTAQTNVASLITATADNATIIATTTTVTTSAFRTFSAYIKRVSGTGGVYMTQNNGATWTDVTSLINSSTYTRVSTTTPTAVTNPTIGFKLATSGDSVAIDMAIDENSANGPSTPFWTRQDRSSDSLTITGLWGFATSSRYRMTADLTETSGSAVGGGNGSISLSGIVAPGLISSNGLWGGTLSGINASNPVYTSLTPAITNNVQYNFGVEWGPGNTRIIMNNARWGPDISPSTTTDRSLIYQMAISGSHLIKNLKIERVTNYNNIAWYGDSITASSLASTGYITYAQPLMPGLENMFTNCGIGGDTIQNLIDRQWNTINPIYAAPGANNVIVIFIGTNTLSNGTSAATAITQLQTLINNIRAAGNWKIVTMTTIERGGGFSNGVDEAAFYAASQIYNNAQRNGTITGITRVIDVTTLPTLQDPNNTTYFDSFKIHPIGAAQVELGTYVANQLMADITMSASSSPVYQNSTGNVVTLTGSNTSWTSGNATSSVPLFVLSGGTGASITSQTITSTTSATVTISAGSALGTLTITDPSSSATTTVTVAISPDSTAPTVSLTAPTTGSTVSGSSVTISANASDDTAVSGVQFKLDTNTNIGAEDTTSTYGVTWDSTGVADGSHSLMAVARDAAGNYATSTAVTVTVDNTAPVRSAGSPSGTLALNTTSTSISLTTNETATCKYSTSSGTAYGSMTSFSSTNSTSHSSTISGLSNAGSYIYYVKCSDSQSNINATDYTISFTVAADSTSPVVAVTAPTNSATVSGASVTISATATDDVSVSGVQFKLDTNTNIGAEDTTSTYGVTWDSTAVVDGSHTIIAVARDGTGNYATSSVITVTVDNTTPVTPPTPLVAPVVRSTSSPSGYSIMSQIPSFTQISMPSFTLNSISEEVRNLQKFLNAQGFSIAPSGPGSVGSETNFFGPLTQNALIRFQKEKGALPSIFNQVPTIPTATPLPNVLPATTPATDAQFPRNLEIGMGGGEDIRNLQKFLNAQGFSIAPSGPGSVGSETNVFGPATQRALIQFQTTHNISPAVGYFGPKTKAKVSELMKNR